MIKTFEDRLASVDGEVPAGGGPIGVTRTQIRKLILSGALFPVRATGSAAVVRLRVSATPIRTALADLDGQGL